VTNFKLGVFDGTCSPLLFAKTFRDVQYKMIIAKLVKELSIFSVIPKFITMFKETAIGPCLDPAESHHNTLAFYDQFLHYRPI
jgi:hypothetical protein